jgi:hypothetical protein
MKDDIQDVDPSLILQRLLQLPVASWKYVWDDPEIRHIGPMAQDFAGAFQDLFFQPGRQTSY